MVKNYWKRIRNVVIGSLIFWALIGLAFSQSMLFGIMFVLGFLYEAWSGELRKRPALPIALFAGGLITRYAINEYFQPIFNTQTTIDLVIAASIFLLILLIGHNVKKGALEKRR